MSGEKIASLYRVSRATAKRMVARAREMLLAETKRKLRAQLGLTSSEFRSVARVVCEDIDVSVVRLLEEGGDGSLLGDALRPAEASHRRR
jgi:RNA polymerase sigma-70 factor (ECF subfamily)